MLEHATRHDPKITFLVTEVTHAMLRVIISVEQSQRQQSTGAREPSRQQWFTERVWGSFVSAVRANPTVGAAVLGAEARMMSPHVREELYDYLKQSGLDELADVLDLAKESP
jgi:hypothetical protein